MPSTYDQRYLLWLHSIRARELEAILSVVDGRYFKSVLECGCGDGLQSAMLKARCQYLVSTDYRIEALPTERLPGLKFLACEVEDFPFRSSSFDMIFSSNLLEHVEDIDKAMTEMRAILRPGGIMVHAVPNSTWKIVQLLLYYPFLVFLKVSSWLDSRRPHTPDSKDNTTIRFESNVTKGQVEKSGRKTLIARLVPPIHGLSRTHVEEIYKFSNHYWRKVFKRNGLEIAANIKMPFYSPYGFGFDRVRGLCEFVGLSSSNCYILTMDRGGSLESH